MTHFNSVLGKKRPENAISICYSKTAAKTINDQHYKTLSGKEHRFNVPLFTLDNTEQYVSNMANQYGKREDSKDYAEFVAICSEKVRDDIKFLHKTVVDIADNAQSQCFICGMVVMLVRNLKDTNKVNGSRGIIVGFHTLKCLCTPTLSLEDNMPLSTKRKIPCKKCLLPDHDVEYPVVEFNDGDKHVILPCEYSRDAILPLGDIMKTCSVGILPLIAAWAITSHRSQGITLRNQPVHIDATNMDWATGSFYVAFSRSTELSQVSVEKFRGIAQNTIAKMFYNGTYKFPESKTYTANQAMALLSDDRILNGVEDYKSELQMPQIRTDVASEWMRANLETSECSFLDLEYEWERLMRPLLGAFMDKFVSLRKPKKRKAECIQQLETFIKEYKK